MIYIRGHHTDYDDWAALRMRWLVVGRGPALLQVARKATSGAQMICTAATVRCASPTNNPTSDLATLSSKPARKTRSGQQQLQRTRNRRALASTR